MTYPIVHVDWIDAALYPEEMCFRNGLSTGQRHHEPRRRLVQHQQRQKPPSNSRAGALYSTGRNWRAMVSPYGSNTHGYCPALLHLSVLPAAVYPEFPAFRVEINEKLLCFKKLEFTP